MDFVLDVVLCNLSIAGGAHIPVGMVGMVGADPRRHPPWQVAVPDQLSDALLQLLQFGISYPWSAAHGNKATACLLNFR